MADTEREVHLNVNRSRITILGFTLSLIVFAIGILIGMRGADLPESASWYRPVVGTSLMLGMSLCLIALWLCLISQKLATDAKSGLGKFLMAEMLMYLALSQVLSGVFQIFHLGLTARLIELETRLGTESLLFSNLQEAEANLMLWLFWFGAVTWVIVTYVAPLYTLKVGALKAWERVVVLIVFVLVMCACFFINTQAYTIKYLGLGLTEKIDGLFLGQFWQPVLWR